MKKLLVILLVFVSFITIGCSKKDKKKEEVIDYNLSGLVIEYKSSPVMYANPSEYTVKLYADKYIIYGYSDEDDYIRIDLTDEEYEKIINFAFSERFLSLDHNLTDPNVLDGSHSSITLYADSKVLFSVGGDNVSNSRYNRLVRLLLNKRREK